MVYNFSKFINKKYGIGDTHSAYISGAVYDVSMVLSPFLGGLIVSIWLLYIRNRFTLKTQDSIHTHTMLAR